MKSNTIIQIFIIVFISITLLSLFSCEQFNLVAQAEGYPADPVFLGVKDGEIYGDDITLTILHDDNSTVYYTTDNSEPNLESKPYYSSILFDSEEGKKTTYTVKAKAYNASVVESKVISISFTIDKSGGTIPADPTEMLAAIQPDKNGTLGFSVPGMLYQTFKSNASGNITRIVIVVCTGMDPISGTILIHEREYGFLIASQPVDLPTDLLAPEIIEIIINDSPLILNGNTYTINFSNLNPDSKYLELKTSSVDVYGDGVCFHDGYIPLDICFEVYVMPSDY